MIVNKSKLRSNYELQNHAIIWDIRIYNNQSQRYPVSALISRAHAWTLFDQPHCAIAFKKSFLDFKLPKRNPYLHKVLTRHVESLLNKIRPKKSLSDQVKQIVSKQLPKGDVDAEMVASTLCMSRHTLYRKLKNEGHAFQELVESVRKEKAIRYIKEKRYSLSEIAFLLGFSELSAFSRAFKRWTGTSPAKYGK